MSKSIRSQLSQLTFPRTCVVCLSPSNREYKLEGTITYGRRTYTVNVPVPMCDMHFEAATHQSPAERFVHRLAVFGGGFFGLACAILLFLRWESGEGVLIKIIGGILFGLGAFALFWWILSASVAPQFASAESKEARTAVRITGYWPQNQMVQLDFNHDSLAERVLDPN